MKNIMGKDLILLYGGFGMSHSFCMSEKWVSNDQKVHRQAPLLDTLDHALLTIFYKVLKFIYTLGHS